MPMQVSTSFCQSQSPPVSVRLHQSPAVWTHLFGCVGGLDGIVNKAMHVGDVASDVVVCDLVALVHNHKEEVKAGHDGSRHCHVVLQSQHGMSARAYPHACQVTYPQRLGAVVAPANGVGRSQDGRPCVERGLDRHRERWETTRIMERLTWMPALVMEMVCCSIAS